MSDKRRRRRKASDDSSGEEDEASITAVSFVFIFFKPIFTFLSNSVKSQSSKLHITVVLDYSILVKY